MVETGTSNQLGIKDLQKRPESTIQECMRVREKKETQDMTRGPIARQLISFAIPLMFGNIFQMLYNTVDSIVVGNFVGTEALAAIGATTMVVNLAVFFFNGFSVGAGVAISNAFGAGNAKDLHTTLQTVMTTTFIACVLFTVVGMAGVKTMLRLMDTPSDVFDEATTYLVIYFAGISGLLVYNIGSAILRAVGDSRRPLFYLVITSILNIFLDLLFVLVFHLGIAGVAYATIISQACSACMIMFLLLHTDAVYHFTWKDMRIDSGSFRKVMLLGLPNGIQSVLTAFSNIFVQGYINYFGSVCMAGWGCYNKVDSFIFLPVQSMAMAATTFVGQNDGAGNTERVNKGTWAAMGLSVSVVAVIATLIWVFAPSAVRLFSQDEQVIRYGTAFLRLNSFFLLCNDINHVLAAALRGRGDSLGPMVIMLVGFVAIRQTYLFLVTRFVANTPAIVGFGYPVGWMATCVIEVVYFIRKWSKSGRDVVVQA